MPFKPNTLICYQGGCYEGCFWEYNYAYIDGDGDFHDIYSSGLYGADTLEKLEARKAELARQYPNNRTFDCTPWTEYDLNDLEDRDLAAADLSPGSIKSVARFLDELGEGIEFLCECPACADDGHHEKYDVLDMQPGDYREAGGIAVRATTLICYDHWQRAELGVDDEEE